jgi:hypothetical protein
MTPEQTLDWLAEQHKSQCNEDRPVQEWIRSMKSMLSAPVQPEVWREAVLDIIDDCPDLTMEQDRWLSQKVKEIPAAQPAPVQEPVAWMHEWDDGERVPMLRKRDVDSSDIDSPKSVRPLVFGDTTPPAAQRQWVGLTKEETEWCTAHRHLIEWAEAKLKEKNT